MGARIVVVGSLNMDLIMKGERIPTAGETISGAAFSTAPGGKGANQAVAAARLGAQVFMVGRVGRDAFGEELLAGLDHAHVDRSRVTHDAQAATGVASIWLDAQAQNRILVAPGANDFLSSEDVLAAEAVFHEADALLLQLEAPLKTVEAAAQLAHAHGVRVILNPAPAGPLPDSVLSLVDLLIPNETESASLAGQSVDDLQGAESAACNLLARGVGAVVLTLGARGALLCESEHIQHFPAFKVVPVDTTAAGDAFVAACSVAWLEGQDLEQAVRWGNAAGALATTKLGAQPSLPERSAVMELLRQGEHNLLYARGSAFSSSPPGWND